MRFTEIEAQNLAPSITTGQSANTSTAASSETNVEPNLKLFSKNLPGFDPGNALHKSWSLVYAKQKYDAKRSGKEWNIDLRYAWDVINNQNWRCALSGDTFTPAGSRASTQASMDRIDSLKGYVKGNIQFLTLQVNLAKRNMSDKTFIDLCKRIAKHVAS